MRLYGIIKPLALLYVEIITHWLKKTKNPMLAKDVTEILNADEGKAKGISDAQIADLLQIALEDVWKLYK